MRSTYRCPVIPEGNVIFTPLETRMHLLGGGDDVCEVFDDSLALGLGDTDDLGHEAWVEEECVPAGDGVCADERVFGGYWVAANRSTDGSGVVSLHVGGVDGCQAFEVGLHEGGEDVVGCVLRRPEGVAATAEGWPGEEFQ